MINDRKIFLDVARVKKSQKQVQDALAWAIGSFLCILGELLFQFPASILNARLISKYDIIIALLCDIYYDISFSSSDFVDNFRTCNIHHFNEILIHQEHWMHSFSNEISSFRSPHNHCSFSSTSKSIHHYVRTNKYLFLNLMSWQLNLLSCVII